MSFRVRVAALSARAAAVAVAAVSVVTYVLVRGELRDRVDEDSVSITVEGAPNRPPEAVARFHTLVTALVDRADLDLQAGRVVLMKRHQARP
jgi:hypothetical protein